MRKRKALAAIIAALFCGAVAAALLTGCQPAKPKIGTNVGTTSTTTDSPEITVPKTEIKDEKPDDEKSADKVLPPGEKPSDGNPDGVKPADEKADKDKPAAEKSAEKSSGLPKGETPTDGNPSGVKPADEKAEKDKPKTGESAMQNPPMHNPTVKPGDWNQWGGTSLRNNT